MSEFSINETRVDYFYMKHINPSHVELREEIPKECLHDMKRKSTELHSPFFFLEEELRKRQWPIYNLSQFINSGTLKRARQLLNRIWGKFAKPDMGKCSPKQTVRQSVCGRAPITAKQSCWSFQTNYDLSHPTSLIKCFFLNRRHLLAKKPFLFSLCT